MALSCTGDVVIMPPVQAGSASCTNLLLLALPYPPYAATSMKTVMAQTTITAARTHFFEGDRRAGTTGGITSAGSTTVPATGGFSISGCSAFSSSATVRAAPSGDASCAELSLEDLCCLMSSCGSIVILPSSFSYSVTDYT